MPDFCVHSQFYFSFCIFWGSTIHLATEESTPHKLHTIPASETEKKNSVIIFRDICGLGVQKEILG